MKKLLSGLMLLAMLSATIQAECSKAEVMKLIDKGFSKAEIASICDISAKSTAKVAKAKSKWISPSYKVCRANGGKLYKGVCSAKWSNAKAICLASGGRLPRKRELVQVISDCGGNINSAGAENIEDPNYQACYKRKGFFSSTTYWSSTSYAGDKSNARVIWFRNGGASNYPKTYENYVRCVRDGQ